MLLVSAGNPRGKLMLSDADRLFGKLAVHNQILTQQQVDTGIALHDKCVEMGLSVSLSRVLLDKGLIQPPAVAALDKLVSKRIELPEASELDKLELSSDEELTLSQLVFRNKLVTKEQLQEAIEIQKQVHALGVKKRLGEILIEKHLVDEDTLAAIVSIQRHLTDESGDLPVSVGRRTARIVREDLFLGRIAVENKLITSKQLSDGLRLQKRIEKKADVRYPMGGLLVDLGHMDMHQLDLCLKIQGQKMQLSPDARPVMISQDRENRLGNLIERNQLVTPEQIEEALSIQQELDALGLSKKLGEILVMKGYLDREELDSMLKTQKFQRSNRRRELVDKNKPASRKKKLLLAAAALGGALLIGGLLLAFSGGKQQPASNPKTAFAELQAQITQLNDADPPNPHAGLPLIEKYLALHPKGRWHKKARRLQSQTVAYANMIDEDGGQKYLKDKKALETLIASRPMAFQEMLDRIQQISEKYKQSTPTEEMKALRKKVKKLYFARSRALAIEIKDQARVLAGAGKLAQAMAALDRYPKIFKDTPSWAWLEEYRAEIKDKQLDSKDTEARNAYWVVQRKVNQLRGARKLLEAAAACDTLPDKYKQTDYAKNLQRLKQQLMVEHQKAEKERLRLARLKEEALEAARIATMRSRIPELIRKHQYLKAQQLIEDALTRAKDPQMIRNLKEDKLLVEQLAQVMTRVREAFSEGLQVKVLIDSKVVTLVGMDAQAFKRKSEDKPIKLGELKPAAWAKVLYKSAAASSFPLTSARFLYRIGGMTPADRLLADTLRREPQRRAEIHRLLTRQGYELPPETFVFYESRWITEEVKAHLKKGEVRVRDEWWSREKLGRHLSGRVAQEAAAEDPNSFKRMKAKQDARYKSMGVRAVTTTANNGPTNRRADIVILSSGYTENRLASFRMTCQQIKDSIGRLDPWGYYYTFINIHIVEIIDKENADPTGANLHKMRIPISGYGGKGYYSTWRASAGTAMQYAELAPGADFIIVVANVTTGSGSANVRSKLATIHRTGSKRWDKDIGPYSGNVGEPGGDVATALAHLLGHSIARLADEYEYSASSSVASFGSSSDADFSVNVTREADVQKAPWHYWLPTPRAAPGKVKCYEGSSNSAKGAYRSQSNCIMRGSSNRYCVVCREQIERTLLKYIRLVEQASPQPEGNLLWKDGSLTFKIRVIEPLNREKERHSRFRVQWFLDGKAIGSRELSKKQDFEVTLTGQQTTPGEHELVARVQLISPFLRRDMGRSEDYVAWRFTTLAHRKPWLIAPKRISAAAREFVRFKLIKQQLPEGFEVVAQSIPEGASFDPKTLTFSWRPKPKQTGAFRLRFESTNGTVSVPVDVLLTVRGGGTNYKPLIEFVPSIEVQAGTDLKISLSAIDINGDQIRYKLSKKLAAGIQMDFNDRTGELQWFVPHHLAGTYEFPWEVTDGRATTRSKLLVIIKQGKLAANSIFPGHEHGLGLWAPHERNRMAQMEKLGQWPISYQVFQLTRLVRDVNASVRRLACRMLRRLLLSLSDKELRMAAEIFLVAEQDKLKQHCVTSGCWADVEGMLKTLNQRDGLPQRLKDRAKTLIAQLNTVRNEHLNAGSK